MHASLHFEFRELGQGTEFIRGARDLRTRRDVRLHLELVFVVGILKHSGEAKIKNSRSLSELERTEQLTGTTLETWNEKLATDQTL